MSTQSTTARREGVTAVHSLDHFVFSVPDLDEAARFYDDFGLDVRRSGDKLHLHTAGHPHRWGTVLRGAGGKRLQYIEFGAYAEDFDALKGRLAKLGIRTVGAHSSDHHMLAFAKSDGPGLHHSSWDVGTLDDVGIGMQQMLDRGHTYGWGVGRHVIGSNYFYYVRDPWGSFAEYSYDIDFIPADVEWRAQHHPMEDAFYVWGPPPPDYFIQNHETAQRRAA